jgi:hypothetical protein
MPAPAIPASTTMVAGESAVVGDGGVPARLVIFFAVL